MLGETITTTGADTILGVSSFILNEDYASITLYSAGTTWFRR